MARALRLARRGLYTTHPNPRVGCVLVRDGEIVGEGFHRQAGQPHAEREALAQAGERARSATAYVTLEPCCHQGRTPPCTEGLIEAGVRRVVAAMQDPNPLVAGQGLERLSLAGIETRVGVLEEQARALNPGFISRMVRGRPYVRCKLASSLDGRTAMASGESQWITGEAARRDVQRLRARSDAIITGSGTLLNDDPSLNVRLTAEELDLPVGLDPVQPLRVVLDSGLETPPSARMLGLPGRTLLLTLSEDPQRKVALEQAGAEVLLLPGQSGQIDLESVLDLLATRHINEVLIEAGARLAGSALAAGLVDELWLYQAPHIMGDSGRGLFHLPELQQMRERIPMKIEEMRMLGDDLRLVARPGG